LWTTVSAIGVPWTTTALDAPSAPAPGGSTGAEDLDRGDHSFADLLGQATVQLRGEQPDLGGPCSGVGADHEHAVGESFRRAVVGDLVAHHLPPPADHTTDGERLFP